MVTMLANDFRGNGVLPIVVVDRLGHATRPHSCSGALCSTCRFPEIQSGGIGALRQNRRIIRCDVCDHGAAVAWPLVARAQRRSRRPGFLFLNGPILNPRVARFAEIGLV